MSFDVESLLTNIPICATKAVERIPDLPIVSVRRCTTVQISELLDFILSGSKTNEGDTMFSGNAFRWNMFTVKMFRS